VANDILTWRSTDGFSRVPAPVTGGLAPGEWRPTPPGFLPMSNPQVATMNPYVLDSPSQFRPAGPPALTSERYTANFNEPKALGAAQVLRGNVNRLWSPNFGREACRCWGPVCVTPWFWNVRCRSPLAHAFSRS